MRILSLFLIKSEKKHKNSLAELPDKWLFDDDLKRDFKGRQTAQRLASQLFDPSVVNIINVRTRNYARQ